MGSFFVISFEQVKVETERRIFSAQCVYKLVHGVMGGNEILEMVQKEIAI